MRMELVRHGEMRLCYPDGTKSKTPTLWFDFESGCCHVRRSVRIKTLAHKPDPDLMGEIKKQAIYTVLDAEQRLAHLRYSKDWAKHIPKRDFKRYDSIDADLMNLFIAVSSIIEEAYIPPKPAGGYWEPGRLDIEFAQAANHAVPGYVLFIHRRTSLTCKLTPEFMHNHPGEESRYRELHRQLEKQLGLR